jgi:hypothetical protein
MENVIQASTYGVTDRQAVKQPATFAVHSRPVAERLSARSKAANNAARMYVNVRFICNIKFGRKAKAFFYSIPIVVTLKICNYLFFVPKAGSG